jgi:mono/diheme cytochrome c family protein
MMAEARRTFAGIAALLLAGSALAQQPRPYDLGQPVSPALIKGWDIDVRPDGAGLPPGQGSAVQGQGVFTAECAACHGAQGQGGLADTLVGGFGTLASAKPIRTVGSYWPYATTLYDYIHRAMPFNAPQSLSPDQVYAVSAYILYLNHIIPQNEVLDKTTLPAVKMPNRNGFITKDPRPDVP